MANIQAGSAGGTFQRVVTRSAVADDISDATAMQILIYPPTGGYIAKDATFTGDGSDGEVEFTILGTDFTIAGKWWDRVRYTQSGAVILTERGEFPVDP